MRNVRNISALLQVLRGAPGLPVGIPLETLAEHQAVKLGADAVGDVPTDPTEIALCVREGLERVARGAD